MALVWEGEPERRLAPLPDEPVLKPDDDGPGDDLDRLLDAVRRWIAE